MKILNFLIPIYVFLVFCSCNVKNEANTPEDDYDVPPHEAIIGKWEHFSSAMYLNDLLAPAHPTYFREFFPNGDWHVFWYGTVIGKNPTTNHCYTIDADYLVLKSYDDDGVIFRVDRYTYSFFEQGNKLKLVTADREILPEPPKGIPMTEEYRANILIFKRLKIK